MTKAVADAGLAAADIVHVNCHATSTVAGDPGEAKAVQQALGDHVVLTAPKSALGHTVGAARRGREHHHAAVDPRRGHPGHAEPGEARPRASSWTSWPVRPRKADIDAALCNSFGFGGHNVAVAFTK